MGKLWEVKWTVYRIEIYLDPLFPTPEILQKNQQTKNLNISLCT